MLALMLLMAVGLLVTAAQPSSRGCSEISVCRVPRRNMRTSTYETCRANMRQTNGAMAKCYQQGYDRVVTNRDCRCHPDSMFNMYMDTAPSAKAIQVLSRCLKIEDALMPGCPAALKDKCQVVMAEVGEDLMLLGTCDARQRRIKEQIAECARYLKTADLSGCGSIQELVKHAAPIVTGSLPLICSGCDMKGVVTSCMQKNMGSMTKQKNPCGIKMAVESMMTCMRAGFGAQPECSPAIALIQKAKDVITLKYIYEACDIETRLNYAQTYAGWGCQGSKDKRRTPLADKPYSKRSVGDALSELWSALTQHL